MKRLPKAQEPSSAVDSRRSVHVIDANDEELLFLCDFLSMAGFRTSGSSHPASALEYIARTHPDVVVCPLGLPDMGGEEIVSRSRRVSPHTQVLLTSERRMDPLPEGLRRASGVDLLRGPFSAVGLLRAVERLVGRDPEAESGE